MNELLWLIPAFPLAGFFALVLAGSRLPAGIVALIGAGSVALSAAATLLIGVSFIGSHPQGQVVSQTLWTWMDIGGFRPSLTLYLDALSLVMALVVTFVGFLIHLYSTEFMRGEEGYSRFFAYMNLFVCSMLVLVLADNLLFLYVGWEGVGLCSYLLIGFWYKDHANGRAAMKAFIVTRVGDTAMAIGFFLLYFNLGTLNIQEIMQRAPQLWPVGSILAVAAAALLLGGALGKSAQLPLQTWLPDAMAGPTPVSALIHAATMVTAGVYLIARTHVLFSLAPVVREAVAVIGALTLLLAGFSALTQRDIKKVLAYSTISQIGYMFLALGVGAWSAAIFHFMTHAFFKALLFLGAGAVILALDHEHDMFRMGGLRRELPVTFWTFLIGAASLSALPLITAGFYSKDMILWNSLSSEQGGPWLWAAGMAGALLTSVYTFRMVFLTFFGDPKGRVSRKPGMAMNFPLLVLAVLSIVSGFVGLPGTAGSGPIFTEIMKSVLPSARTLRDAFIGEGIQQAIASAVSLIGICLAYLLFLRYPGSTDRITSHRAGTAIHRLLFSGWGFDRLYDAVLVRPFLWIARTNKDDLIDLIYSGLAWYSRFFHDALSLTQSGKVRWYAMGITIGAVITIGIAVLL
jgi:NADH-quinone oxidoreductase subunit L